MSLRRSTQRWRSLPPLVLGYVGVVAFGQGGCVTRYPNPDARPIVVKEPVFELEKETCSSPESPVRLTTTASEDCLQLSIENHDVSPWIIDFGTSSLTSFD